MGKGKVFKFIVLRTAKAPRRIINGTLREVEQLVRGEIEIRRLSVDEALEMNDVEVEEAGEA